MTTILTVDEDTDVLRLLRIKLTGAGYTVQRARDGAEALQASTDYVPDLIITELLLPDVEGLELLSGLRSSPHSPVIIVLSQLDSDAVIGAALASGASDYMTKPFSPQALLERLRVNLIRTGRVELPPAEA